MGPPDVHTEGGNLEMTNSISDRILSTPSGYAKQHYLYVQEIGTLTSVKPHISSRENLSSYLFLAVIQGAGYLTYRGRKDFITAGDCVYIDCRYPYAHESTAEHPWTLMWVHFNGHSAEDFYKTYGSQEREYIFRPNSTAPYTETLGALYSLLRSKPSLMELSAHRYLTDLVTLCITEPLSGPAGTSPLTHKLEQVRSYLEEHYDRKLSLEALSSLFFISKYHLSREYKKRYGTTIISDLTARRISRAKSLLRFSDFSVDEIAQQCGFQDSGYFIKVFRRAENMTPLEYRRKW